MEKGIIGKPLLGSRDGRHIVLRHLGDHEAAQTVGHTLVGMERQAVRGEGGVRSGRFPMILILFRTRRRIWNIGGKALRLSVNDVGPDAFQAEIPIEGIDGIGNVVGDDIW